VKETKDMCAIRTCFACRYARPIVAWMRHENWPSILFGMLRDWRIPYSGKIRYDVVYQDGIYIREHSSYVTGILRKGGHIRGGTAPLYQYGTDLRWQARCAKLLLAPLPGTAEKGKSQS
jgi:hypothetical protein